jgi:uncharacterized protein
MLEKLMPKSDEFFDDFDAQCAITLEGARLLHVLLKDFTDLDAKVRAIKEVEHRGDAVVEVGFNRLHTQFITPFDRAEIHRLLGRIDDVLDLADAAAVRLNYYELPAPREDATELARLLVVCCEKMQVVVKELRHIKKPDLLLAGTREIKKVESMADEVLRAGMARLFKSGLDPLTVIKWKEIYDLIETATDRCQDVANIVAGVVLEHS